MAWKRGKALRRARAHGRAVQIHEFLEHVQSIESSEGAKVLDRVISGVVVDENDMNSVAVCVLPQQPKTQSRDLRCPIIRNQYGYFWSRH